MPDIPDHRSTKRLPHSGLGTCGATLVSGVTSGQQRKSSAAAGCRCSQSFYLGCVFGMFGCSQTIAIDEVVNVGGRRGWIEAGLCARGSSSDVNHLYHVHNKGEINPRPSVASLVLMCSVLGHTRILFPVMAAENKEQAGKGVRYGYFFWRLKHITSASILQRCVSTAAPG
ncbi:hypothetical protein LY78DRAFT_656577 [Colletotrichum sublineola]|nr:hypothetical protein LY78DRAFT_656577 [Colletotrichum sublineola]